MKEKCLPGDCVVGVAPTSSHGVFRIVEVPVGAELVGCGENAEEIGTVFPCGVGGVEVNVVHDWHNRGEESLPIPRRISIFRESGGIGVGDPEVMRIRGEFLWCFWLAL